MTSKEAVTNRLISNAVFAANTSGIDTYEDVIQRIQDRDMLNRDLTRSERNMVRGWYGLPREVSETEQCA